MEIVLDRIVPQKEGADIIYLQLVENGVIIDTKSLPYSADTVKLKADITDKFQQTITIYNIKKTKETEITQLLASIKL